MTARPRDKARERRTWIVTLRCRVVATSPDEAREKAEDHDGVDVDVLDSFAVSDRPATTANELPTIAACVDCRLGAVMVNKPVCLRCAGRIVALESDDLPDKYKRRHGVRPRDESGGECGH